MMLTSPAYVLITPARNEARSIEATVAAPHPDSVRASREEVRTGLLIVNADDWGRERGTTTAILNCALLGTVSSVSAMVFMDDSERAAAIAQERGLDPGLHLNLTTPFSARNCSARVINCQQRVAKFLLRGRFAQTVFHPGLIRSFDYIVRTQLDEFRHLYEREPGRIDGHHHMHLCANVLLGGLLPSGIVVRGNFSFVGGEKSYANILYRRLVDFLLKQNHRVVDYFYNRPPIEPLARLQRIFGLAREHVVELETHPVNPEEYGFLTKGGIGRLSGGFEIAPRFLVPRRTQGRALSRDSSEVTRLQFGPQSSGAASDFCATS